MRFNHDRQVQWAETMKTDGHDLLHTIQGSNSELLEMVRSTTQEVVHSIHTLAESMTEWTQNMTSQGAGIAQLEHQARFPEGHSHKTESPQFTSPHYPSGHRNKQSESESEHGGKMSQKGRGKKRITKLRPKNVLNPTRHLPVQKVVILIRIIIVPVLGGELRTQ